MKVTIEGKVIEFRLAPEGPIEFGDACLVSVGDRLTFDHYYADIAGSDWIVQPDRLAQVGDKKKQD